jgi:hypothetical protein
MMERLRDPKARRRAALWLLFVSLALGNVNLAAVLGGVIPHWLNDVITNYLSWLALTVTALDVVATTDVRVEVDGETPGS